MSQMEQQSIQKQRVTYDNPGGSTFFVHFLPVVFGSIVAIPICVGIMSLLWRYGGFIGAFVDITVLVVFAFGACTIVAHLYITLSNHWHENYRTMLHRNIVHAGDVVIRVHPDGTYDHLSAEHQAAAIAPPKDESLYVEKSDQDVIRQWHEIGTSQEEIAGILNKQDLAAGQTGKRWNRNRVRETLKEMGLAK